MSPKISDPLLDRMDIHIEVPSVKYQELRAPSSAEDSNTVRQRVIAARDRQLEHFRSEKKTYSNAQMAPKLIPKHCGITVEGEKLLENAVARLGLSARARDRILKVSRTMADRLARNSVQAPQRSHPVAHPGPLLLDLSCGFYPAPLDQTLH
jgi:magnesium chelatase family protein